MTNLYVKVQQNGGDIVILNKNYDREQLKANLLVKGSPLNERAVNSILENGIYISDKKEIAFSKTATVTTQKLYQVNYYEKGDTIIIYPDCSWVQKGAFSVAG